MRRTIPLLVGLTVLAATAASQEPDREFFEAVDVHVVTLDVVVTDEDGEPIRGLGREDFTVLEDGEPVELTGFLAIEGREIVGTEAPEDGPGAAERETRRLNLVVVIDDLHLSAQNQNRLLETLEEWITASFSPRDRGMIVAVGSELEVLSPFTNDPEELRRAIRARKREVGGSGMLEGQRRMLLTRIQRGGTPPNPSQGGAAGIAQQREIEGAVMQAEELASEIKTLAQRRQAQAEVTLGALASFTDTLAGMPGRKAIVLLSDGLPLQAGAGMAETWLGHYEDFAFRIPVSTLLDEVRDMTEMQTSTRLNIDRKLERLVARASADDVVFYPLAAELRVTAGGISAERLTGVAESGAADSLEMMTREGSLLEIADGTGGVSFRRSTALDDLLERIERDFDTFYSLGYTPRSEPDGDYHEVEVRVDRSGARVRHASGYQERGPIEQLQDRTLSALFYGIEENPLQIDVDVDEPVPAENDRYRVPVTLKIPFDQILLLPHGEKHVARLTALVIAQNEKGEMLPVQRIELPIDVPNDQLLETAGRMAGYPFDLELGPGRQTLAIGIRDHLARSSSTLRIEVPVGVEPGSGD